MHFIDKTLHCNALQWSRNCKWIQNKTFLELKVSKDPLQCPARLMLKISYNKVTNLFSLALCRYKLDIAFFFNFFSWKITFPVAYCWDRNCSLIVLYRAKSHTLSMGWWTFIFSWRGNSDQNYNLPSFLSFLALQLQPPSPIQIDYGYFCPATSAIRLEFEYMKQKLNRNEMHSSCTLPQDGNFIEKLSIFVILNKFYTLLKLPHGCHNCAQ